MLAGKIVVQQADGMILHFDVIGYVMCGLTTFTLFMMYFINKDIAVRASTVTANP